MKNLSTVILGLLFACAVFANTEDNYPLVMWSEHSLDTAKEYVTPYTPTKVFDQLKAITEAT